MSKIININNHKLIEKGNVKILLLITGTEITPEDTAMLQALYSRSPDTIINHLEKIKQSGSGKFMEQYYVKYGHKSIGDCGFVTLFIEGVSMLCAKAIQDNMLYVGQECSTRYIDFSKQPFVGNIKKLDNIKKELRDFYLNSLNEQISFLKTKYPLINIDDKLDEKEKSNIVSVYEKAIKARAFDIIRGFLPAGAETSLAWTTNLRQASDKLSFLRNNPSEEIRNVADMIEEILLATYPNSFSNKRYKKNEIFINKQMENYYFNKTNIKKVKLINDDIKLSSADKKILNQRPEKSELHHYFKELGTIQFEFLLDFASFRDIQRHRSIVQRMPLLTTALGFNKWYMESLAPKIQIKAKKLLSKIEKQINNKKLSNEIDRQYYIPMGYNVSNRITADLPALIYLLELRSQETVHPTLRKIIQEISTIVEKKKIKLYINKSNPDTFNIKRGEQDIIAKDNR